MKYKTFKKNSGFTIIETLIVLAIAGLILLIVFLAVPALQRSARNNSRKNDAAAVLSAISDYTDNNAGSFPNSASWTSSTSTLTICNAATAGTSCSGLSDAESQAKLGYYTGYSATAGTTGDVSIQTSWTAPSTTANDSLTVYAGATCASATASQAGASRSFVAIYGIEASGKYVWQCTES